MRWCPVCADEMIPEFGSPCEDPIAWSCRACGFLQLETGTRPMTDEQLAALRGMPAVRPAPPGPAATAVRAARELLAAFDLSPPVDVERAAAFLGYPIEWVRRAPYERGGIARRPGGNALVVNREYPFRTAAEWRWVVAEELGHALLGHSALAASEEPADRPRLREPARRREEREAKRFAAELLMPAADVRAAFRRVQGRLRPAVPRERDHLVREIIADLAHEFQVSHSAMRTRLDELDLLH